MAQKSFNKAPLTEAVRVAIVNCQQLEEAARKIDAACAQLEADPNFSGQVASHHRETLEQVHEFSKLIQENADKHKDMITKVLEKLVTEIDVVSANARRADEDIEREQQKQKNPKLSG